MNQELKTKSRTQRITTGIIVGAVIICLAIFGRMSGERLAADADVDLGNVIDGLGVDLEVDGLELSIGETGDQPGCGGSNCLVAPDISEYSGLAGETSFLNALIIWTNFFLGFLSVVAMIALIYSGFLYVTAAGNDEQANKAKKIIIWVVVGIVVILLAYALVNTLIEKGPTGSDS